MGRLLAPFGIKGWVRLKPFTAAPETLLAFKTWWLAPDEGKEWTRYRVAEAQFHGGSIIAAIEGVVTREAARALRGFVAGVPRSSLPEAAPDEHYWRDLIGLVVVNRAAQILGKVVAVLDTGAHPVLRIEGDGGERLIPLVGAYVDAIEPAAGRIVVDWRDDY
ncbi:MAG TPA: ribosome maturation factor RimM [Casimicrobiaceae bacterium]